MNADLQVETARIRKRPLSVTVIGWLFVVTGIVGLAYHATELDVLVLFIRFLALVAGVFMLRGASWARWLAIAWIAFHVIVSAFNSVSETVVHGVLLAVIAYVLLRPEASAYFRATMRVLLLVAAVNGCAAAQNASKAWTFEQLLRLPTAAELQRMDRDWAEREGMIDDVTLVDTASVPVGSERFEARLYTYTLSGSRRCGAVLLPPARDDRPLAGLIDIGDVRWDYPDRNLTSGLYVAKILGDRARDFVLLLPCARGMGLRIGDLRVGAEGDRRDAWEGVAKDAIAFLTVALLMTREIDRKRLGVYGYSRGGGVALIVGERDTRIKAVLAFAAPTDWFSAMGRPGVNWPERMEAAWRDRGLQPDTRESQFLDWFVRDREALPLADLRRRLIGASPLYFIERLPAFQIHQGEDDRPVPARNAILVRDRLTPNDSQRVFLYQRAGHMLDDTPALTTAREFLVERLVQRR